MKINSIFSSTRNLVSKIVLLTASGTAAFGVSNFKEIQAQEEEQVEVQRTIEKKESKETKFERLRKEQEVKLKEIISLQEKDKEKVAYALTELEAFYSKEYLFYSTLFYDSKNERAKLLEEAKPYLEKIFEENLELILSDDSTNRNIARKNILELINVIPWNDAPSFQSLINAKKYLEPVFNEQFKDISDNSEITKTKIETGLYLLMVINSDKRTKELNNCAEIFANWLEKKCSLLTINANNNNDTKSIAPILEKAISDLILGEYQYLLGDQHTHLDYRLKLFSRLIKSYTQISNLRKAEPNDLNQSTRIIYKGTELTAKSSKSPELANALHKELVILSDHTTKNIFNLEDSEEKTNLIYSLLVLPGFYFISENPSENQQELIVDPLNKYYLSRKESIGDTKVCDLFIRSVEQVSKFEKSSTSYSLYVLFKIITDNPEYFEAAVNKQIGNYKKDKSTDSLNNLGKYFVFFNSLSRLNNERNIEGDLREKIKSWSQEKACDPIVSIFIERLNNERVTVKELRQERYLNTSSFEELNNFFSNVISDPFYTKKLIENIEQKLKEERDPYQRRMYYETLCIFLPMEMKGNKEINVTNFIPSGITAETSQHAVMGLSRLIAEGIAYEHENIKFKIYEPEQPPNYDDYHEEQSTKVKQIYIEYKDFFERLERFSKGEINCKKLTDTKEVKFTPMQLLILDLINISNGDMKRIKELTKREFTPPTFWRTYRNKQTGEITRIPVTPGNKEEYEKDKHYRDSYKTYEFVSEKIDRSKQDPEDGIILSRTMQNARSVLAYSASLLGEINENMVVAAPNPDGSQIRIPGLGITYKRAMLNLFERRIGYYTDFENLGMEVSAYLELCSSYSENNDEPKQELDKRLKNLKDYLFEDKYALLPIHERNKEITRLRFKLASKVLESAPPMQRRNQFDYLVALGFSEHELLGIQNLLKLYEK